ncbi:MAG: HAD hydrolase-like protein [Candidatus Izimaplasma sp.]|nr:HAD hydrolase-like protein [Candidatus Izimaplasma bacterium]
MDLTNVKTIFFDYDGTLHNSLKLYKPAFLKAYHYLVTSNYKKERNFTDQEIAKFLGQSPKGMWDNFAPELPEQIKQKASQLIGQTMNELADEYAELYPQAKIVLNTLKQRGYTLVFISNCTNNYMKKHIELFDLDYYFDLLVNAEMYHYSPKEDILKDIIPSYKKEMIIIGDRHHDITAGKKNNIYTVGCTYGYGKDEIKEADYTINSLTELLNLL